MGPVTTSAPSPAAARQFIRRELAANGAEDVTENAELAVSELVTNAMAHGHSVQPMLGVSFREGTVRIEVSDDGPPGELHSKAPDPTRTGGFGLFIVESIANRWGTTDRPPGKTVWFELDLPV